MTVVLDELLKAVEQWLNLVNKPQPYVNPDLDPVLLVPGIAGSILNAVDDDGKEERIWVRILSADHEFRDKLWSRYDPSTGRTLSLDPKTRIVVPEDRYGLYAIDVLDPDLILGSECVCYFHDMIVEMLKWGFQEGKTLFGFGYDFRQSNRLPEILSRFAAKLESVYSASGGKKITVITHSMGGVLVKCFMALHSDIFEKYVKNWIAIAAPFQGAPGYINSSLLNGMSFVEGWEQNFFISKWSMQQLNAPFFVTKLGIKTLPCVILFRKGVATDRVVGFQDLGAKDDFSTGTLERLLLKKGIITEHKVDDEDRDIEGGNSKGRSVRSSVPLTVPLVYPRMMALHNLLSELVLLEQSNKTIQSNSSKPWSLKNLGHEMWQTTAMQW